MGFLYVGPARLAFTQADGGQATAAGSVTVNETMPGLFELTFAHDLPAAVGAVAIAIELPDGQALGGEVRYLARSSLTFWSAAR